MNVLYVATSILFFLWLIRSVITQVALWQLKEYRFDRILIHIRETGQGRQLLFSPLSIGKSLLILGYVFVVFEDTFLFPYYVLIFSVYLLLSVFVLRENFLNLSKQPVYTPKAIFIVAVTLFILFIFYAVPLADKFLWLLLLDKVSYFFVGMLIFALSFPTEIQRDLKIQKAKRHLSLMKNLLVVGVTGSYGKSSTKEYTAQILAKKFSVVRTTGTNNTPIGIAQTILKSVTPKTEIFVVEMGAYKRGEIAEMCEVVHPKIGILTAVNDQHLSLFGSLENTKKAKYELIKSLPKDGIGLFNGNNENVLGLYRTTRRNKVLYSVDGPEKGTGITATDVKVGKRSVQFAVLLNDKKMRFEAPLLGAHAIENILPGIYLADRLGMSEREVRNAVLSLRPVTKTMIYHALQNGVTIIDDTFNANPDAVIAALRYAATYKGKKILVMQPMIELGKKAKDEHLRVGRVIGEVCDALIVTNKNFLPSLKSGIDRSSGKCEVKLMHAAEAAEYLQGKAKRDDVIVFEGKEAAYVLEKLL